VRGRVAEAVAVGEDGVDLPALAARRLDPDLVLLGVATGTALGPGDETCGGQPVGLRLDDGRAADLDAEVVERAAAAGVLDEDQLERRLADGEVGVAGLALGRLGGEQLRLVGDGLFEVVDVEGELDARHAELLY
jgi:hypothetical protein